MKGQPMHALSFDVEEFFQVANLRDCFAREEWDEVPSRLDIGMEQILGLLERRGIHATFFFLGWIAERHPKWVRRCVEAGHEVASHGYEHSFLWDIETPEALHRDLERTEDALRAAGAPTPRGFRASTFTLTRSTFWAFDVLIERGYLYDSSIHPIRHPVYGVPEFDPGISRVRRDGGELVEFPVSTWPFLGRNLPMGGGGYFRLLPGWVTRAAVRSLERRGRPVALYLHPWEFDPDQPRQPTSALTRFRHTVGLGRTLARLDRLIERFRFGSMEEVLRSRGDLPPG
ncbi:MAG TPA: DUF3473 domain-containing protein [Planctomycetes bacterium]|nr:DUF3473 domain-containing protein [Planctomycetota bacterium]